MSRRRLSLVVAALVAMATGRPNLARAENGASQGQNHADLRRCLRLADRNHPNIAQAQAKLAQVRAQLRVAYFAPYSAFRAVGGVALAPTIRGSSVFSPNTDASLTSSLGVGWRMGLSGVLPVWTFGKITNLWDAAEANVALNRAGVEVARDAVRLDVRKAYLGLQLARDSLNLLGKAQSEIDDAVEKMVPKVEEDEADPIDLLKLQTFAAELHARKAEAERYQRVAIAGLRYYTGVTDLQLRDEPLKMAPHRLRHRAAYLAAARLYRPEVKMARAGLDARKAQLRLSRSNMYPNLGLALSAGFSAAPEVADQINPFVSDGGNYFHYGLALVLEYKLDFVPGLARIAFAEGQLQEVMALDRKALGGVAAEVEKAHAEVEDWGKRVAAYRKALKYAKKWLSTVQQAIDIGTMDEKELIEPAKSYALQRYNMLNAMMEHNLALSKLAQVTGWDAIAP